MHRSARLVALSLAAVLAVGAAAPVSGVTGSPGAGPASDQGVAPRHVDVAQAAANAVAHPRAPHPTPERQPRWKGTRSTAPDRPPSTTPIPRVASTPAPSGSTGRTATPAVEPAAAISGPPYTALFYDAAPGQTFMDGEVVTRTPADATISVQLPNASTAYLQADSATGYYSIELIAPDGGALTTGTYTNAVWPGTQGPGQPAMFVTAHGTGCDGTGSFTISELTVSAGAIIALAAAFSYACPAQTQTIIGEIRYQSSVAVTSALDVSPWKPSLGTIPVGRTTAQPFTIRNTGASSLVLGTMGVTGAGTLGTDGCSGRTLAAGGSCVVNVNLAPSTTGAVDATLAWTDSSARGSHQAKVSASAILELDVAVSGAAGAAVDVTVSGNTGTSNTCTSNCAFDVTGVTLALRLTARAPVGYDFSAWGGACTGRDPCIVTMSTSRSVTATFVPILGSAASALRVGDGQAGYRDGEFGCALVPCMEPPDPVVAANATQVVSASNGSIRVRDRAGKLLADLPLWAFFLEAADTVMGGDPQIVWDATHSRWIASEFSASCDVGFINVAISDGANAAGGWGVYELSTGSSLLDFPGLGISLDKVAIGGNAYDLNSATCEVDAFSDARILSLPLATMIAGGSITPKLFSGPEVFTPRPAVVLDATADLPVVFNVSPPNGGDPVDVAYAVLHGAGSSTRLGAVHDLTQPSLLAPLQFGPVLAAAADPPKPAGFPSATVNPIDARPLGAWVRGSDLWFTSNQACQPAGDAADRSCARTTRIHLRAGYEATPNAAEFAAGGSAVPVAGVRVFVDSASGPVRFEARWDSDMSALSQARAQIRYGAPGTAGPVMFNLCGDWYCPPWGSWGGTLTAADFQASAQVATYAAAITAIQQGNAYVELYSDFGGSTYDHVRGQLRSTSIAEKLVFDDILGMAGQDLFHPAVGFATDGTIYAAWTQSGGTAPLAQRATWAATTDTPGTFRAPSELSRGQATYAGERWGDYVQIAPDPASAHAVWASHEYVMANGSWQAWSSQLVAGSTGTPTGTVTIDGGAASTTFADVTLELTAGATAAATEALVSDSPVMSAGVLSSARRFPLGKSIRWSLIDPAVGGLATTGTKTVYVQFGNGIGGWTPASPVSASITLTALPAVTRLAGPDRFATSAAISAASFQPGVAVAFVATGLNFPDALAGAAVAGRMGSPVLLVSTTSIPDATKAELARLKPDRIVILGSAAVVSAGVATALRAYAPGGVFRIAGTSRYETAAYTALNYYSPGVPAAFIATGLNFPDALAGAAAAGSVGGPILLVDSTGIPTATAAVLDYLAPQKIYVLGSTAVISSAVATKLAAYTTGGVTRLAGADRYATAAAISKAFNAPGVAAAYVATGLAFPDALSAAPVAGSAKAPVILVSTNAIPAAAAVELDRLNPKRIVILGSTGAVSAAVADQLARYVTP